MADDAPHSLIDGADDILAALRVCKLLERPLNELVEVQAGQVPMAQLRLRPDELALVDAPTYIEKRCPDLR